MSRPESEPSLPKRITALAAAGTFALAGCTTQPEQGSMPDTSPSIATPGFDLDSLPEISKGVCAHPQLAKIALRNCLLLPPVTEGSHFTVVSTTMSDKKEIASIRGVNADYTKLSPAFQEVFKDVMDDTVPAAALAGGTPVVVEQEPRQGDRWDEYKGEAVHVDIATDGSRMPIGELRAIMTHESAHAVTADWEWESKKDAKILSAFSTELYFGIEDARKNHGDELLKLIDEFCKKVNKEYKHGHIRSKIRDGLLDGARNLEDDIKVPHALGARLVDDGYGVDHTTLRPLRSVLLDELSDADIRHTSDVDKEMDKLDQGLSKYLAKRFSYVTESMNMDGMVEWKLGHPWDGSHEYIASLTANVELAPDKFVSSVKAIKGSQSKTVTTLIKGIAEKYKKENPDVYGKSNFPYVMEQLAA